METLDKKYIIKRLLIAHKDIDFLMFQEIKVTGFQLDIALKCIWEDAKPFSTNHERGRGGTSIPINLKWKNLVVDWGSSPCNRVVWVVLENQGNKFGVCWSYAPNDHMSRVSLSKWMSLLHNITWKIVGDFNMIESQQDNVGGCKFERKGDEKLFWNSMISKYLLFDPLIRKKSEHKGI